MRKLIGKRNIVMGSIGSGFYLDRARSGLAMMVCSKGPLALFVSAQRPAMKLVVLGWSRPKPLTLSISRALSSCSKMNGTRPVIPERSASLSYPVVEIGHFMTMRHALMHNRNYLRSICSPCYALKLACSPTWALEVFSIAVFVTIRSTRIPLRFDDTILF